MASDDICIVWSVVMRNLKRQYLPVSYLVPDIVRYPLALYAEYFFDVLGLMPSCISVNSGSLEVLYVLSVIA